MRQIKNNIMIIAVLVSIFPTLSFAGEVDLPRTGQTTCYDADGNVIDCTGTGQDGEIQKGMAWPTPRFTLNSNGTVTDNLTGLIWLKDGNCFGLRIWNEALDVCNNLASGQCGLTDGSVAGDWSLPNIVELESLLNRAESKPAKWLNDQGFTNVQFGEYSSATTYIGQINLAHGVSFYYGYSDPDYKPIANTYVWAVRGGHTGPAKTWRTGQEACYNDSTSVIACDGTGQDGDVQRGEEWPASRFYDNSNGTVTDNLTGLIWLKDANGFGLKTWNGALDDCNNLENGQCGLTDGSVAGDWRLANRKELVSLIDFSQSSPALPQDHLFINVQSDKYWSSTTYPLYPTIAWCFDLNTGRTNRNKAKTGTAYVWPVQDVGPCGNLVTTIEPSDVREAGAQWRVDGGTWHNSGYTHSGLSVANHTVEFKSITGWIKPGNKTVTINEGQTTNTTGIYDTQCPNCSGSAVVLTNVTFPSGFDCECVGTVSITIGSGVTIPGDATVTFQAPVVTVQPEFHPESGATVHIKQ